MFKGEAMAILGPRLHKIRTSRSLSQSEVARRLGVSRQRYHQWEQGAYLPPAETIPKLATTLLVDSETLTEGISKVYRIHKESAKPEDIERAKTIRKYRKILCLTQKALAASVGVAASTVCQWEKCQLVPGQEWRKKLEKSLSLKENSLE